jgi:PAS domain S-box-containing protein
MAQESNEHEQLERLLNFYSFLIQANGLVVRADDLDTLYEEICHVGVRLDRRLVLAWFGMSEPGSGEVLVVAHAGPAAGYLEDIRILAIPDDVRGRGPTGRALREGRCIISNRFLEDPITEPWQAKAREFGIAASASIPLRRGGEVCGALVLYANTIDVFDERIAGELDVLSQTLSYAIDAADERVARRAVEARLLESQQTMRAILDAAHQSILMTTPEGDTLAINRKGAERLGMTPQEIIGRNQLSMMPPEVAQRRRQYLTQVLASGAPLTFEDERDGRLFRTTLYPILEGAPRIVIYAEEITGYVAAERAAREAEHQLVQVVNLATEGILVLDLDGNIVFANPRLHDLLGVAPGALRGRSAVGFISAANHPDFFARVERIRAGARAGLMQVSYWLRRTSGEEFPALISAAMKTNDDGVEDGLVAVVTDISELQRTQAALAENEQRLEIALAGAGESIWQWNIETGEAYWSPEFYRQLGYADQEFPGNAEEWFAHMHPDDIPVTQEKIRQQIETGQELLEATYRFRAKNGEWRWITGRGKVIRVAEDGHAVMLTGTNVDVTEQQLDAARNRRQGERWLALLRLVQTGEYEDEHGEHDFFAHALEEAQRLTGSRVGFLHLVSDDQQTCELVAWTAAALQDASLRLASQYPIGRAGIWVNSFHERHGLIINDYSPTAGVARSTEDAAAAAVSRLITVPVIENDRVRVIAWVGDKAEPYDQDDLEFLQILAADAWRIVRRRRAEAELRDALQVVEASPVVWFRWRAEPGWPIDYVSQNVSRWGWSAADLLAGQPAFEQLVHPEDLSRVAAEVNRKTAAGENEYAQRYRLRRADGTWFWVEDSTRVIRDISGVAIAYEGVVTDINADVRREQSLADSLEAQRALNRKLEVAQNQLLQSEKMASIGQLAAGVAHEINNPIGFVNSNLGTLNSYLGDIFTVLDVCLAAAEASPHPADFEPILAAKAERELDYLRTDAIQLLAESREGLERVRKIVQDLRDFSRVGETQWQWADIHHGLDSTLNIVWNELKYTCEVIRHYGKLPQINCVPSQLNQVFMNLLVNAAQSIEGHGQIVITTECVGEDAVRVSIADTGRGIPAQHLKRIFEPFFTTKPVGKGTGLGLSLAWSIVERHGGRIEVSSEIGKGTTFSVTLPIEPVLHETGESAS